MESTTLAQRFREVLLNGTWVANTNFKDQLQGLDWKMATTRIENLNTIALLAQHIHYYIKGVNQVFEGGTLDIRDQFSFDFPEMTSQTDWESFLERFFNDAESFASNVEQMSEAQLKHFFVNKKYGNYQRNIDGMIEHSYYHLGQITLIKKLILSRQAI